MQVKPWEVWFASVRFEDAPTISKPRPVIITSYGDVFICAFKVTTHEPRDTWGEYQLTQWQCAGLDRPSTVRLSKLVRLQQQDMIHRVGTLHPIDVLGIQLVLCKK